MELEKNQTIKKGQIYYSIAASYSKKGWSGYTGMTIVKAKVDHFFTSPSWWNKEIFEEIDGCIPLYDGQRLRSAFRNRLDLFKKEYPGMIGI